MKPLVSAPVVRSKTICVAVMPFFCLFSDPIEQFRHCDRSRGWNSGFVDPFLQRDSIRHVRTLVQEIIPQITDRFFGRDALETELSKIVFQILVKSITAEGFFEALQKQ